MIEKIKGIVDKPAHYCDFCGKGNYEVERVIAGPSTNICSECIELSAKIVEEESKNVVETGLTDEDRNRFIVRQENKRTDEWIKHIKEQRDDAKKGAIDSNRKWCDHAHWLNTLNTIQTIAILLTCALIAIKVL